SSTGPRSPSWPTASGNDNPARTPEARWSSTSGHASRSRARRRRARERTRTAGAAAAIAAKHVPIVTDRASTLATPSTTMPTPTLVATRAPGVTDGAPAGTSRSCVRAVQPSRRPSRGGLGAQHDHQTQNSPAPNRKPTATPTSAHPRPRVVGRADDRTVALRAQEPREVDPGAREPLGVRREAVRPHEPVARPDEDLGGLDHALLDATRDPEHLAHDAAPVGVEAEVHDEVDRRRDGRHDEPVRDVRPGEQRQRAHLGDRLASRVGVDRAHAGNARVQGDEQVEALGLAALADDDAVRAHAQRLLDQAPQRDLPRPLEARLAALQRHDVPDREAEQAPRWQTHKWPARCANTERARPSPV